MAITSVTFQYPVAKVADSPWNTIINGLNYTKTNLAPVPLKNAESYHSTNGMSLPQSAYCAIPVVTSNPTSRSYTWMGGMRDSKNPDKYWLSVPVCDKGWGYGDVTNSPYFNLMTKKLDDSSRVYTEITTFSVNSQYNCRDLIYQNEDFIYVLSNNFNGSSTSYLMLTKLKKMDGYLSQSKITYIPSSSIYCSDFYFLGEKNGKLYIALGTTTSSSYSEGNFEIYSYNLASDTFSQVYSKTLNINSNINIMCSDIQNNELYFADLCGGASAPGGTYPKIYKLSFNSDWSTVTEKEMSFADISKENVYSTILDNLLGNTQLKVFMHSYSIGSEKYLVKVNVRNNTCSNNVAAPYIGDSIKFYKVEENTLTEVNSLGVEIYNIIPKNNWNSIFAACNSGIRVYALDKNQKKFIEQPSIDLNLYQFGFDLDERLWVLSRDGSVSRYNYNQPATISYSFEKDRYALQDSSPVSSYVNVSVMNYMGEPLNMTVTLQAIGNFTFQGGQKEIQIALNNSTATQIPVIITGAGTYQLILR